MNCARFRQVLEHIESHPKEWNQRNPDGPCGCFLAHSRRMFRPRMKGPPLFVGKGALRLTHEQALYVFYEFSTLSDFRKFLHREEEKQKAK